MDTLKTANMEDYQLILKASDVAEILSISKRVAYEIMDHEGFPLIRIGRCKRVSRDAFFKWLERPQG
jgi:predicted DNA-binding transcriptional regulator AlpA